MRTLLQENNDVQFTWISGKDCLKQRIQNRLSLFLGEWIHRPDSGTDWYSVLGRKTATTSEYEALVKSALAKDSEITSITDLSVTFVDTTEKAMKLQKPIRSAIINYTINSVYGTLTGAV